jgi:CheY-like chemotaxis protein
MITDEMPRFHPRRYSHHILYVGNDLGLSKLLKDRLKDCQIVRAPTGYVGRIFIKSDIKKSLILLDENLPDMTGLMLASFTRSLEHRKLMPIIILSENRCKRAGVIFNKPNEVELLIGVIKDLLETQLVKEKDSSNYFQ